MTVAVGTVRNVVEITWDTSGETPDPPEVNVPEFPTHPIVGDPSGPRPDNELPGDQPRPEHPIYLPPYIDNSLPDPQPHPEHPIVIPPDLEEGLSDEQIEKLKAFIEGNLPPYEGGPDYPAPVSGVPLAVQVFAQGQDGDWSNTAVMPNDGRCVLTYPEGFSGESYIEVRDLFGELVDSGTIQVDFA